MRNDPSGVGQKIRDLRNKMKLTQEHLAQAAKVSVRTVQRLENEEVVPSYETLRAIASVLDHDVYELTGEATSPPDRLETEATCRPHDDIQPTVLTPTDIRVLRQARSLALYWDKEMWGSGYSWLTCYGVPRDISRPDEGYSLVTRTMVAGWWATRYLPEARARITRSADPNAMLHWQSVVDSCQPEDILYLIWGCDHETTPEHRQEGLCVDTLALAILRDDEQLADCRLITRIVPPNSPKRLFRLKSG